MLAQGEAAQRRNPGIASEEKEAPEGRQNLRSSFCHPSGAPFHFAYVSQGLLALLAAPWANIGRPSGAEDKKTATSLVAAFCLSSHSHSRCYGSGTFSITNGTSTTSGFGPMTTNFAGTPASLRYVSVMCWCIVVPSSLESV
jgi:hypothetical protein